MKVTFTYEAPAEAVKKLVAFEALYENEVKVAKHEDRNDEFYDVDTHRSGCTCGNHHQCCPFEKQKKKQ